MWNFRWFSVCEKRTKETLNAVHDFVFHVVGSADTGLRLSIGDAGVALIGVFTAV